MKVTVLGSASSIPGGNEDSPCYLINDEILFDCGYSALYSLKRFACDISKIKTIVFSHLHHDHYLGLAQFIFHIIHAHPYPLSELTIYGPDADTLRVVSLCCDYLQLGRFYKDISLPRVIGLTSDKILKIADFTVRTRSGFHPVAELLYRFTEIDETSVIFGGDGAYSQKNDDFLLYADAIFHDSTLGCHTPDDNPEERGIKGCGHSSIYEAVSACENCNIPNLFPVHINAKKAAEIIASAEKNTKINIINPEYGSSFEISQKAVKKLFTVPKP